MVRVRQEKTTMLRRPPVQRKKKIPTAIMHDLTLTVKQHSNAHQMQEMVKIISILFWDVRRYIFYSYAQDNEIAEIRFYRFPFTYIQGATDQKGAFAVNEVRARCSLVCRYFGSSPTISPGTTYSSNCAGVRNPRLTTASFKVVPSACAFFAACAALS